MAKEVLKQDVTEITASEQNTGGAWANMASYGVAAVTLVPTVIGGFLAAPLGPLGMLAGAGIGAWVGNGLVIKSIRDSQKKKGGKPAPVQPAPQQQPQPQNQNQNQHQQQPQQQTQQIQQAPQRPAMDYNRALEQENQVLRNRLFQTERENRDLRNQLNQYHQMMQEMMNEINALRQEVDGLRAELNRKPVEAARPTYSLADDWMKKAEGLNITLGDAPKKEVKKEARPTYSVVDQPIVWDVPAKEEKKPARPTYSFVEEPAVVTAKQEKKAEVITPEVMPEVKKIEAKEQPKALENNDVVDVKATVVKPAQKMIADTPEPKVVSKVESKWDEKGNKTFPVKPEPVSAAYHSDEGYNHMDDVMEMAMTHPGLKKSDAQLNEEKLEDMKNDAKKSTYEAAVKRDAEKRSSTTEIAVGKLAVENKEHTAILEKAAAEGKAARGEVKAKGIVLPTKGRDGNR